MMTLIGVAITVAYLYNTAIVFGLEGMDFFWELATLILIMPNPIIPFIPSGLPRSAPPGRHRLVLINKQKKIFDQEIKLL